MISLKVPPLGESIVEATVSRWLKQEGETVAAGDTVVELDTDKITVEVPALKAGVLTKRAVNEGDVVKVDDVLGEIDETAAGTAPEAAAPSAAAPATPPAAPATPAAQPAPAAQPGQTAGSSPAARRIADEKGIDISTVQGTGRGGVVSKPDVLAALGTVGTAPATPAPAAAPAKSPAPTQAIPQATITTSGEREVREKMTTRRKRIAENLLNSHLQTARLTTFNEIDMSAVIALRERVKAKTEKQYGVKLSFMPFFVKAACIALKEFPVVNAQIDDDSIIYKNYVNMGIAVASDQGLIVPNIKDADQKGILQIAQEMNELAKRARDSKLTMDDLTGGTFTITNGGVFGSLISTPIINYPQVAILGLHKIQDRPMAIDGKVEIRPMMYVAMSYDHRIIDGQQAVLFVVRIKELMEDPAAMLIN
jgi:2-oxoglutarate dehydrogenase E2 component (dihydrolipoamide succinyltransferase)